MKLQSSNSAFKKVKTGFTQTGVRVKSVLGMDKIKLGNTKFHPVEVQLMDKVRKYGKETTLETIRLSKRNKLVSIKGLIIEESSSDANFRLDPQTVKGYVPVPSDSYSLKNSSHIYRNDVLLEKATKKLLKGKTLIHDHPDIDGFEYPLSQTDVYTFSTNKLKRIINTTSSGGFSVLTRKITLNPLILFRRMLYEKHDVNIMFLNNYPALCKKVEGYEGYMNAIIPMIENFAKKFGWEFDNLLKKS